jgi:hypothetical protein
VGIVILWVVLLALLVRQVEFGNFPRESEPTAAPSRAISGHERDWMEIFLEDQKVGYAVSQVTPLKGDYLVQEEMFLSLNLLGHASVIQTLSRALVDRDFFLKSFRFRMESGVVAFRISGTVTGNRMELEVGEGKARRNQTIHLSGPVMIPAGMSHFFKGRDLAVGRSFAFPLFDPSVMASKELKATVTAKETVPIGRMSYEAFRVETRAWGHPVTIWVDESGSVLKETGFMGMTLIKSSAANAPFGMAGAKGRDLYELAAVPVKGKLSQAERVRHLKLREHGLEELP